MLLLLQLAVASCVYSPTGHHQPTTNHHDERKTAHNVTCALFDT